MAWETEVAKRLLFLQKELVEKDARIGWLENEFRKVQAQLNALSSSVSGVTDEEVEDAEEPSEPGKDGVGGLGNQIKPVTCENDPGMAKAKAPFNHQHQGVGSIKMFEPCDGAGGNDRHVGDVQLKTINTTQLLRQNDGFRVNDRQGNAVNAVNWNPTRCDPTLTILHPWNAFAAGIAPGGCVNVGCPQADKGNAMPGGIDCDNLIFPKVIEIDCSGHVKGVETYRLLLPSTEENYEGTLDCCEELHVVTGMTFSCTPSPTSTQWKLTYNTKEIVIPEDDWTPTSPPGSCSGSETEVVTGITVASKGDCQCGKTITVTYGCIEEGGGLTHTSVQVLHDICFDTSTCVLKKRFITIEVVNPGTPGSYTDVGNCP